MQIFPKTPVAPCVPDEGHHDCRKLPRSRLCGAKIYLLVHLAECICKDPAQAFETAKSDRKKQRARGRYVYFQVKIQPLPWRRRSCRIEVPSRMLHKRYPTRYANRPSSLRSPNIIRGNGTLALVLRALWCRIGRAVGDVGLQVGFIETATMGFKSSALCLSRYLDRPLLICIWEHLLLPNHLRIVALTPDLQKVSFYNRIKFLHHRSTIKFLLLLILIK